MNGAVSNFFVVNILMLLFNNADIDLAGAFTSKADKKYLSIT